MEAFGLLESLNKEGLPSTLKQRAIVKLGAGRGYLSHMLCDCYAVHKVVMVERRATLSHFTCNALALNVSWEPYIQARILPYRIQKMYENLASTLHLWIEDCSTNIFNLEVVSINLNLIMFKYDTIHVEYRVPSDV